MWWMEINFLLSFYSKPVTPLEVDSGFCKAQFSLEYWFKKKKLFNVSVVSCSLASSVIITENSLCMRHRQVWSLTLRFSIRIYLLKAFANWVFMLSAVSFNRRTKGSHGLFDERWKGIFNCFNNFPSPLQLIYLLKTLFW